MENSLDNLFAALSDPTRRKIIEKIKLREYTVVELSALFDMSLTAVSKHLKVLNNAKLILKKRDGKYIVCRYNPKTFDEALNWISRQYKFWSDGFDSLEKYLDSNRKG